MEISLQNIRSLLFKELRKVSNLPKKSELNYFVIKRKIYAIERISKMLNESLLFINYEDKSEITDSITDEEFNELIGETKPTKKGK